MAYEDFTTFTYADDDGDLTIVANKIEVDSVGDQGGDTLVYKDYGANHFDSAFTHQFEITVNEEHYDNFWAISGSTSGLPSENITYFGIGGDRFFINDYVVDDQDSSNIINYTTKYYITIVFDGANTFTATIRTGSHAGAVFDTISVAGVDPTGFRYLYAYTEFWD